jgi:hypothetical protein
MLDSPLRWMRTNASAPTRIPPENKRTPAAPFRVMTSISTDSISAETFQGV